MFFKNDFISHLQEGTKDRWLAPSPLIKPTWWGHNTFNREMYNKYMPYALFMVCGVVERHLVEAYKNDLIVMEAERLRVVVRTALSQFNSQSGPAKYFYLIILSFRSLNILICLVGRWAFFDRKLHFPLLGFELRPAWWTIGFEAVDDQTARLISYHM